MFLCLFVCLFFHYSSHYGSFWIFSFKKSQIAMFWYGGTYPPRYIDFCLNAASAQWSGSPHFNKTIILICAAPEVRTTQGTTVVLLHSGWNHPKSFYGKKTKILWANLLSKMEERARESTHYSLISQVSLSIYEA